MLANRLDKALSASINASRRSLNPHRLTWVLIVISYLAGWQLNLPLLYGITAIGIALLIISFFWPAWLLRAVQVQVVPPNPVQAGDDIPITLSWTLTAPLTHCFVKENLLGQTHLHAIPALKPDEHRQATSVLYLPTDIRGTQQVTSIDLLCSAPFGLIQQKKTLRFRPITLAVTPDTSHLGGLPDLSGHQQTGLNNRNAASPASRFAAEPQGLREYQFGDSYRHWHPSASARALSQGLPPVVNNFAVQRHPTWLLVLDTGASSVVGEGSQTTFEFAIRLAASLMKYSACSGQVLYTWADGPVPLRAISGASHRIDNGHSQLAWLQADSANTYDYRGSIQHALTAHPDVTALITIRNQTSPAPLPELPNGMGHMDILLQEQSFIYPVQSYDEGWFEGSETCVLLKLHRSSDLERLFKQTAQTAVATKTKSPASNHRQTNTVTQPAPKSDQNAKPDGAVEQKR